jgi:TRAP-type C4-dicarboxylate transport system permease small subunit
MFILGINFLSQFNKHVLRISRNIGAAAVVLMVCAILVQVFFRYILNNALPWPDEAARFCMLWMTGLMAPTAFRRGGFVAIDTINQMLPRGIGQLLSIALLLLSLLVLSTAVRIGYNEVTGFGGKFTTASLYLPLSFDFQSWYRIPRSWMMMSLLVGVVLLFLVNIELIGRNILRALGYNESIEVIAKEASLGPA